MISYYFVSVTTSGHSEESGLLVSTGTGSTTVGTGSTKLVGESIIDSDVMEIT